MACGVMRLEIVRGLICFHSVEWGFAGESVATGQRVEIHDDTCTWHHFRDGRPPLAGLGCHRCGTHPVVHEDGGLRCAKTDRVFVRMIWSG
jgi:hypothetical protein